MKWIIYLLLVFNIGFAAWHFRGIDSREDGSHYALDLNNENQLILLAELKQKQEMEKRQQAGAKLCYSVGPFSSKAVAEKAEAVFKKNEIVYHRVRLRDTSRRGYWVLLPASESRKEANEKIKRLRKLKVKDYFLVATGEKKNAVSLGVFSQQNLARRRVDDMIRLGFVPSMERVALPRKVYWLNWYKDLKKQPGSGVLEKVNALQTGVQKVERSCK